MNKKSLLLLPALALLLAACQNGGNSNKSSTGPVDSGSADISDTSASESGVTGVELDHESLELQVGQSVKLAASVKPISLDDREVVWSSDHPEIASVDASGMVTAAAQGQAKIKAAAHADPTKFAECPVTVSGRKVTIAKLTAAEAMAATEELKFGANQKNAGGYYFFKGTVDGSTRGETSQSWADGVNVKLEQVPSTTDKYYVTFTKDNAKKYFEMDDVHHFAVVDTPTAGREWAWNETYATVQRTISGQSDNKNNGTFLPGTYQTYTTISGCNLDQAASDFFFQFVYQTDPVAPTTITLSAASDKIYQGGTLQVEAELAPAAAEGKLVWSVTGDSKVTIDQNGLLSAAADATLNGKVTVKAAYEKDAAVFGTLEITVAELVNYGTIENPLTIAQAKAVIDKFAPSITGEKIFVKGFVATNHAALSKTARTDLWLTNDDGSVQKDFELYAVYADEALGEIAANALVGKEVIAEGWGTLYKGTYEFSNKNAAGEYDNGFVKKITTNTRTATSLALDPNEAFEIEQGKNKAVTANLLPYGAAGTISFAVAPANQGVTYEDGQVVASATATAGNYTLTATSGSFTASVSFTVKAASAVATEAVYSLIKINSANTSYSAMFDVEFEDGKQWKIPGNQSLDYGLKIGGKPASGDSTNSIVRNFYSKSVYSSVSSLVITHGSKDAQITVNSLKLYVFNSAADAAGDDLTKAAETVTGTFVDSGTSSFAPAAGTKWEGKFFKVVYDMTTSSPSSNKGVVLKELKVVF